MILFNKPSVTDIERKLITEALSSGKLCGDGGFTKKASNMLSERLNIPVPLLTTSCSHALDMSAMLLDLKPGDEVIMPSFTFVSTANAVVLRGAKPVFAEIDSSTLNMDPDAVEPLITGKTKAVFTVHYAGASCDMDKLTDICKSHNLPLVEDAAQTVGSTYKGRQLGAIGQLGAFSFHETKNYVMGEGGALIISDEKYRAQAEIIREKGTNRSRFIRGEIDKYTWQDVGSSYLPSDVLAAMLCGQLERFDEIMNKRMAVWNHYHKALKEFEDKELLQRHAVNPDCNHNAHMYYFLAPTPEKRNQLLQKMKAGGVMAIFHYIPLHTSAVGESLGYKPGNLPITENCASRLIRLPLYADITEQELDKVIEVLTDSIK